MTSPLILPPQGIQPYPSPESYFHRGAGGGLTIVYTGAANQTSLSTQATSINRIEAYPFTIGDLVTVDTIYMEVTTGVANAVGRCGIYRNTNDQTIYPGSLVVDSGELAMATNGVKSAVIAVTLAPGLYWLAYLFGVAGSTMRMLPAGAVHPCLGIPSTIGVYQNNVWSKSTAYAELPATAPQGGAFGISTGFSPKVVGLHFA